MLGLVKKLRTWSRSRSGRALALTGCSGGVFDRCGQQDRGQPRVHPRADVGQQACTYHLQPCHCRRVRPPPSATASPAFPSCGWTARGGRPGACRIAPVSISTLMPALNQISGLTARRASFITTCRAGGCGSFIITCTRVLLLRDVDHPVSLYTLRLIICSQEKGRSRSVVGTGLHRGQGSKIGILPLTPISGQTTQSLIWMLSTAKPKCGQSRSSRVDQRRACATYRVVVGIVDIHVEVTASHSGWRDRPR